MGEGKNRKGSGREQRRTTKVRLEFSAKAQYCSISYIAIGSRVIGLNSVEENTQTCVLSIALHERGFHTKAENERFTVTGLRCGQSLKYENFRSSFGTPPCVKKIA